MADRIRDIDVNRKARHEYEFEERFEAGIRLLGSEVKSLRQGKASLREAYVTVRDGQAWLKGCHISPYDHATHENHEPTRDRKLLLHAHQIAKLEKGSRQKGMTIVPLRLYFKDSWAKVEIALARGKKLHDKRESLKRRQHQREIDRRLG